MVILDTMVVSSLMRDPPDAAVVRWMDARQGSLFWITSVTAFEISVGLRNMPEGRKRQQLEAAFDSMLKSDFSGRVLGFDLAGSQQAARFASHRRQIGRPVGVQDSLIVGIAAVNSAAIATRNTKDFDHAGVELINPWEIR